MIERPVAIAILNPQTGRLQADHIERLLQCTLEPWYALTIRRSRYAGEACLLARQAAGQADLVIAVGGDGTASEVASGILGTSSALAIIPSGSTNMTARALGIPTDLAEAARALVGPTTRRCVDVAVSNDDHCFLHMAGTGFDALTMRDASQSLKRVLGWLAYVPPALSHLDDQIYHYRITVDGSMITVDARMVLVANGSYLVHPRFPIGREIRMDDGLLDVCIFTPPDFASTAAVAGWFALGRVDWSRHFLQYTGKAVRIESDPPSPIEFDGDFVGMTPLDVRVRPAAIPIVVPARGGKLANSGGGVLSGPGR
jgi:diacylglycerol kinase (ATP)